MVSIRATHRTMTGRGVLIRVLVAVMIALALALLLDPEVAAFAMLRGP